MSATRVARLRFEGRFVQASFADFVRRRAERLDLRAVILDAGESRFTVEVAGQHDLVDAFEMACSLGPLDCLVLECGPAGAGAAEMVRRNA